MIVNGILQLIYYFIYAITSPLRLLGDVVLNSNFESAVINASSYLNSLNVILPVDTMLIIFGVSLTLEFAYLVFKIIMWIIKKIPTIN